MVCPKTVKPEHQEVKPGRSEVQGHLCPPLQGEFEGSLSYIIKIKQTDGDGIRDRLYLSVEAQQLEESERVTSGGAQKPPEARRQTLQEEPDLLTP